MKFLTLIIILVMGSAWGANDFLANYHYPSQESPYNYHLSYQRFISARTLFQEERETLPVKVCDKYMGTHHGPHHDEKSDSYYKDFKIYTCMTVEEKALLQKFMVIHASSSLRFDEKLKNYCRILKEDLDIYAEIYQEMNPSERHLVFKHAEIVISELPELCASS